MLRDGVTTLNFSLGGLFNHRCGETTVTVMQLGLDG